MDYCDSGCSGGHVQVTSASESNAHGDLQYSASSHHCFLSSQPTSPLSRRDLSQNNANPPLPPLSSHSVHELPMKDTWDDKDVGYATDHLIFSFEKLGSHLAYNGKEDATREEVSKSDALTNPRNLTGNNNAGQKEKRNGGSSSSRKGGGGGGGGRGGGGGGDGGRGGDGGGGGGRGGGGGVRSAARSQAAHCRTLSAPMTRTQSVKLVRRKAKPSAGGGGGKVPAKQWSGGRSKGETGDFSHHYRDPETLVSTYKGGNSSTMPQQEMEGLQHQLQSNALRQQEIERQLRSLDDSSDDDPAASNDLIDLTSDPQ
ncbi:hypothetical protein ACOMHN_029258 [Nucella lapillus]